MYRLMGYFTCPLPANQQEQPEEKGAEKEDATIQNNNPYH